MSRCDLFLFDCVRLTARTCANKQHCCRAQTVGAEIERVFPAVMRGLDPRIHLLGKTILAKTMDRRAKPGDDGFSYWPLADFLRNQAPASITLSPPPESPAAAGVKDAERRGTP